MARNDLVRPDANVPHCIPKSTERSGGLTRGSTQRCSAKPCELGAEHQWSSHFDVCRRQLLSFLKNERHLVPFWAGDSFVSLVCS